MKMVLSRFGNLGVVVGLAGTLSQAFFLTPNSHAQSIQRPPSETDKNICKAKGQYAVFAQHPLTEGAWRKLPPRNTQTDIRNNEWAHEHIFFCNNGIIIENIGFGNKYDGSRFSYSDDDIANGRKVTNGGILEILDNPSLVDFVPISNNRYDTDIIKQILGLSQNSCTLQSDGKYGLVRNNCQDFTARVRAEYEKRMLSGDWTRTRSAFQGKNGKCSLGSASGQANDITLSENNYVLTVPGKFAKVDNWYTTGAKGKVEGKRFHLKDTGNGFVIIYDGTISSDGNTIKGDAKCWYESDPGDEKNPQATRSFTWERKTIGPSLDGRF